MAPSSDKPTIVCDGAGKVVGVNDAWSALCGYTESEALGKRPADLLQCETTEFDVAAEFTKTLLATGRSEAILTNRTKDGRVFKHRLVGERLGNLLIAEGTVIVPPAPRKAATRKATRASSADVWGALVSLVALLAAFAAAYDLAAAPDEHVSIESFVDAVFHGIPSSSAPAVGPAKNAPPSFAPQAELFPSS